MARSIVDAEVRPCFRCGKMVLVWTPAHLYCDDCKKAKDRERALENYYKRKKAEGKPRVSKMGRPPVRGAPQLEQPLYLNDVDGSNRIVKMTCKRGHPLTGDNVHVYDGRRVCKTCKREALRRYRAPQPEPVEEVHRGRPKLTEVERAAREEQRLAERRKASMVGPLAELWPYGADDPVIRIILSLLPDSLPDSVRADAGQEVYLQCLAGELGEGEQELREAIKKAIKSSYGEYAVSIDWRREDGFAIADLLEGGDLYV